VYSGKPEAFENTECPYRRTWHCKHQLTWLTPVKPQQCTICRDKISWMLEWIPLISSCQLISSLIIQCFQSFSWHGHAALRLAQNCWLTLVNRPADTFNAANILSFIWACRNNGL